jgi:hypothetical protein
MQECSRQGSFGRPAAAHTFPAFTFPAFAAAPNPVMEVFFDVT